MFFWMALLTALLLALSGMASLFETALATVNRLKIKAAAENGNKKAIRVLKILDHYDEAITAIVMFNNFVNILLPTISLLFFIELVKSEAAASTISTIVMSFLVIVCGEIIPKLYGRAQAQRTLYSSARVISFLIIILKPITFVLTGLTDFLKKFLFPRKQSQADFDEEIITMVNEEHEQGNLERNQKNLITKAIMFNDKTVGNIMQPKNKVVMVDEADSNVSIYKEISQARFSRIPVYREDTNNIIGIINEREFLSAFAQDKHFPKEEVMSEPLFVPDTMKISLLLPQMQSSKQQLAIVVDEYGVMQGIITIEDMLEELVGEIWDEHDEVIKKVRRMKNNQYLVESDVLLSDLAEIIKIDSDEDMTIAKYILSIIERIPQVNDTIEVEEGQIIVKQVKDNSIEQVLIIKNEEEKDV